MDHTRYLGFSIQGCPTRVYATDGTLSSIDVLGRLAVYQLSG